ncbi:hypothetical protein [Mucilaginibacter sp. UR6-11]|uniref:hypothetical protein n=1 Tax=Mucilaginibacter sp. UR6-11 TaxID=1435644 RepID=UPI001E2F8906|nr:hypothetical protein [Mucilaginibacter sp. UR6-11]MCC8424062.1 hypothetical protein [Mucilaginibacter sp. UR6-11]
MKTLRSTIMVLGLSVLVSACHMNNRHVIITDGDDRGSTRIEYAGRAFFNINGTAITHITPNGYVKYKRDGRELVAESDKQGEIFYRINDGEKQTHLNADDSLFLARAVKDMIKHGHNKD